MSHNFSISDKTSHQILRGNVYNPDSNFRRSHLLHVQNFYRVLFCGGDLERALAFKDQENAGVDRYVIMYKM